MGPDKHSLFSKDKTPPLTNSHKQTDAQTGASSAQQ